MVGVNKILFKVGGGNAQALDVWTINTKTTQKYKSLIIKDVDGNKLTPAFIEQYGSSIIIKHTQPVSGSVEVLY